MAVNSRTEMTIDVSARIQVLKNSIEEVKKVLDTLKPDSSSFKQLDKLFASMTKRMEDLEIQTSKTFKSQGQFDKAERSINRINDSLSQAKFILDRVDFSHLKLPEDQRKNFDELQKNVTELEKSLRTLGKKEKTELFKNEDFKNLIDSLDPNLATRRLQAISDKVREELNKIKEEFEKTSQELKEKEDKLFGGKINNFLENGIKDGKLNLGTDAFNFNKILDSAGRFKTGGKNEFYSFLQKEFSLEPQQLEEIKDKTQKQIVQILSNLEFWAPQLKKDDALLQTLGPDLEKLRSKYSELEKQLNPLIDADNRLTTSLSAIETQERKLNNELNTATQKLDENQKRVLEDAKSHRTFESSSEQARSSLNSLTDALEKYNLEYIKSERTRQAFSSIQMAITNFMGFNQVLNLTKRAVKEAMDHIKQLDSTMNAIAIVSDMTTEDLWKQVDVYSEMAQRYGTSIQGAYEVSKIYYQAGYETNDVLTLMNETLKMSKVSGLDYATTTDYMMNALRGFKLEVADASHVVDVYSGLAQNTAVSQQELAEAMSKTASSMEGVGSTFEETSSMIATMVAVTRETANNIGSSLKSIASRYGELTKDPKALFDAEGEEMSYNKVDAALKSVGISLQTTDHQFRSFTDVILELAHKWSELDSVQQRYDKPVI